MIPRLIIPEATLETLEVTDPPFPSKRELNSPSGYHNDSPETREVSEITFTSVYGGVDKNGKTAAEAVQRRSNDDNGGYDRSQVTLEGIVYCFDVDEDIAMNKSTAEERVSQADEKGVYGYAIVQVNQRIRILKDCSLGKAGDAYDKLVSYVMIMQDKNSPWEEKGSGVVPYDYKKTYERYISRKTE